jgi:ATP-dependent helicase HrpA
MESSHGGNTVRAFPALVAQKRGSVEGQPEKFSANITLFSTQAEQLLEHPLGVRALVLNHIQSPAKYVQEHLTAQENLALATVPYQNFGAFIDDILAAVVDRELDRITKNGSNPAGLIFTKKEFEAVRSASQAAVMDTVFHTVGLVAKLIVASREAAKAISQANSISFLGILSAEKAHIDDLLKPKFVSEFGLDKLPRVLVYLQAIKLRVDRLVENPNRDRLASVDLEQALTLYANAGGVIPLKRGTPEHLVQVRWMLEELRVSLFAQSLGTPEPVSVQRIKKALA